MAVSALWMREDPRAGGDGPLSPHLRMNSSGRPPRGRGRHGRAHAGSRRSGKTPARAGTARWRSSRSAASGEDPRAGGDGVDGRPNQLADSGRPPRGRGRRFPAVARRGRLGKTPARAGTAYVPVKRCRGGWEDPRAGGDGVTRRNNSRLRLGRPPRGRGRPNVEAWCSTGQGKTPARAGTAEPNASKPKQRAEDPRAGGDGGPESRESFGVRGRPPRGRGRRMSAHLRCGPGRKTPARAGTAGQTPPDAASVVERKTPARAGTAGTD